MTLSAWFARVDMVSANPQPPRSFSRLLDRDCALLPLMGIFRHWSKPRKLPTSIRTRWLSTSTPSFVLHEPYSTRALFLKILYDTCIFHAKALIALRADCATDGPIHPSLSITQLSANEVDLTKLKKFNAGIYAQKGRTHRAVFHEAALPIRIPSRALAILIRSVWPKLSARGS